MLSWREAVQPLPPRFLAPPRTVSIDGSGSLAESPATVSLFGRAQRSRPRALALLAQALPFVKAATGVVK